LQAPRLAAVPEISDAVTPPMAGRPETSLLASVSVGESPTTLRGGGPAAAQPPNVAHSTGGARPDEKALDDSIRELSS
jgi:hypothetical protein